MPINTELFRSCQKFTSTMGFQPYKPTFTMHREPGPILRPLSMTKMVQLSFTRRKNNHTAFKIVPKERVPPKILATLDVKHDWGAQVMFTGGVMGSFIVQDLATKTGVDDVMYTKWDMPGAGNGERLWLFSVMARSKGAERFSPDMLMEMHVPELAETTQGAHVFHFYDEGSAKLFYDLLILRIEDIAEAANRVAIVPDAVRAVPA